ncbi:hypothetical protein VTJ49DRAFT_5570 [Mycothermus thermophilus]|uniref:Uncharacterized protein n=1 Tax=Humicola insolens TaxID=85995 RepID=A0ABR3V2V0_HUMIN
MTTATESPATPPTPPPGSGQQPQPPATEIRQCTRCKKSLPLTEFVPKRPSANGPTKNCSHCRGAASASRSRANAATKAMRDAVSGTKSVNEVRDDISNAVNTVSDTLHSLQQTP